ncbi:MAG TPA: hypothetical protein V6C95_12250 [Coleofasciculaceae cyanobacterium]
MRCLRRLWRTSSGFIGKKNHKKAIRSRNRRIAEHQEKIRLEYEKDAPDEGLIRHWKTEIRAFEKGIQQALKRWGK